VADNSALRRQRDRSRHDSGRAALFETSVLARLVIVDQELLDHRLNSRGRSILGLVSSKTAPTSPLQVGSRSASEYESLWVARARRTP